MTSVSAKLLLFAVIFTVSSSSVFAGPVYYGDAVIQRAGPDAAPGLLGIHEIISQTGVATTWNYWADEVGNQLTPVIFKVSNDELEITGIGETHSATALGDQGGLPFNLASGTADVVEGMYRFGHYDGDPDGEANTGTVSFDGGGASNWAAGGEQDPATVAVGNMVTESPLGRQYSIQIGIEEPVPEPSSIAILLVGLIAGFRIFGRRRRAAA